MTDDTANVDTQSGTGLPSGAPASVPVTPAPSTPPAATPPASSSATDQTAAHVDSTGVVATASLEDRLKALERHVANAIEGRIESLETTVESATDKIEAVAVQPQTHTVVQEIVNFLHWMFPNHPVPGTADPAGKPPANPA